MQWAIGVPHFEMSFPQQSVQLISHECIRYLGGVVSLLLASESHLDKSKNNL